MQKKQKPMYLEEKLKMRSKIMRFFSLEAKNVFFRFETKWVKQNNVKKAGSETKNKMLD